MEGETSKKEVAETGCVIMEGEVSKKELAEKDVISGIIYLSKIPKGMNVSDVRSTFEQHGEVGRIYLEPEEYSKGKKNMAFKEGWVEFKNKNVAKRVASSYNNTQVGGKRKSKSYHELWCLKYLPKFQWIHLNEVTSYKQATKSLKRRTEIAQVRREASAVAAKLEASSAAKRSKKHVPVKRTYHQHETEEEVRKRKKIKDDPSKKLGMNDSFLKSIFSGGSSKQS